MSKFKLFAAVTVGLLAMTNSAFAASISLGVSGKGAINDSTIIAGEPFSADFYFTNDSPRVGFTLGFKIVSDDVKKIVHVADSGNGINDYGDIKAYNGWEDNSIWDLQGLFVVENDWDGALPDLIGFGGVCIKKQYEAHEKQKCISLDLMVPTEGTFVIDSAFFPPSGKWIFAGPNQGAHEPNWGGPYKFNVVSQKKAKAMAAEAEKKSEKK